MITKNLEMKRHLEELEKRYQRQVEKAEALRAQIAATQVECLKTWSANEKDCLWIRETGW